MAKRLTFSEVRALLHQDIRCTCARCGGSAHITPIGCLCLVCTFGESPAVPDCPVSDLPCEEAAACRALGQTCLLK
jgi:hypothetical protein